MGLLNIIRRMHLRQKLSIREIARLTGVSRNTVTKHLAANTIEPKFATPERWSWFFDQLFAAISYSIGFMSGGSFQVRVLSIIGLCRGQQAMR